MGLGNCPHRAPHVFGGRTRQKSPARRAEFTWLGPPLPSPSPPFLLLPFPLPTSSRVGHCTFAEKPSRSQALLASLPITGAMDARQQRPDRPMADRPDATACAAKFGGRRVEGLCAFGALKTWRSILPRIVQRTQQMVVPDNAQYGM